MLTLLIKGDIPTAFKAADAHHVKLTALAWRPDTGDVRAAAPADAIDRVRFWFLEDIGPAPFPAGSLLHYACGDLPS